VSNDSVKRRKRDSQSEGGAMKEKSEAKGKGREGGEEEGVGCLVGEDTEGHFGESNFCFVPTSLIPTVLVLKGGELVIKRD